jgi:hypothetical protein
VIDEIEARWRRARAWHEANGVHDGARIFLDMLAWMAVHGPELRHTLVTPR